MFLVCFSNLYGYDIVGWAPEDFHVSQKYIHCNATMHLLSPGGLPSYEIFLTDERDQEVCLSYYTGKVSRYVCAAILDNAEELPLYKNVFEQKAREINYSLDYAELRTVIASLYQDILKLRRG